MTDSDIDTAPRTLRSLARHDESSITILGAGPAGALMATLLAQRGHRVLVFERLPDLRRSPNVAHRSINLALADRGIHALKRAGAFDGIARLLVPMRGRMLHELRGETFIPYGREPHEVIYSISRAQLTAALLDRAEQTGQVELRFRQPCISVDGGQRQLCIQDIPTGKLTMRSMQRTIGADGAGSVLRRWLVERCGVPCREDVLAHGYKELTIAPDSAGRHRLDPHALHIWPRGEFMLIALPNVDGSFTATLFLPQEGSVGFAALTDATHLQAFFQVQFPDALRLLPDLERQFFDHPTGSLGTVYLDRWSANDSLILIGDAAHAVVPFHGQGMNCAFEDCVELDALLGAGLEWPAALREFERRRKPNADAIAAMALANYVEMRDTVRDPKFKLQKELSLELERRFPERFIPQYSMVMFHHEIPYAVARERGTRQQAILAELTHRTDVLAETDFALAERLIAEQLDPIEYK